MDSTQEIGAPVHYLRLIFLLVVVGGIYFFASATPKEESAPQPSTPTELEYVHIIDQPQVRTETGVFSCTEAGSEHARAGKSELRTIQGVVYCITTEAEGAAGSTYIQYAYVSDAGNGALSRVTFTIRTPQCANYEEPKQSACKAEQAAFNPDAIITNLVH